jgi:hypothetical protein
MPTPLTISLATIEVSIFVALAVFFSCSLALVYSRKVKIQQPPVGRTNWKDATVLLVAIPVFTLLVAYAPSIIIVALLVLSLLVAFTSFLGSIVKRGIVSVPIALVLIATQLVIRNIWLNDAIVVSSLVFVSSFFMQTGMKSREVVYLAIGYSVYDLASLFILPSLVRTFTINSPVAPLVIILTATQGRVVGGGDILLLTLFVATLDTAFGIRIAAVFAGVSVLFTFVVSATIAAVTAIPISPFLTLAFLAIVWGARGSQAKPSSVRSQESQEPKSRERTSG